MAPDCPVAVYQLWPALFAMAGVPEKVVHEVESVMASAAPVNSKVDTIVQLLRTLGLGHDQVLTPAQILVHPENRGKSMVSFHDVWSKGTQMCSVGFQKRLLDGQTICTQLATAETKRIAQVQANRQLVSEAKGHLAPVSGQEGPWVMHAYNLIYAAFVFLFEEKAAT